MAARYTLQIISAEDVAWTTSCCSEVPNVYVKMRLGNNVWKSQTPPVKGTSPSWNTSFDLNTSDENLVLSLRLKHRRSYWPWNKRLGEGQIQLSDLLQASSERQDSFLKIYSGNTVVGRLHLRLIGPPPPPPTRPPAQPQPQPQLQPQPLPRQPQPQPQPAPTQTESPTPPVPPSLPTPELYHLVGNIVEKLEKFVEIVDVVSEIHPYLSLAWRVTSALYRSISRQYRTDEKIVNLARVIEGMFDFVYKSDIRDVLQGNARLRQAAIQLLNQTTECFFFMKEYTQHGFLERMLVVSASRKIDEFEQSLLDLKRAFVDDAIVHSVFISSRTLMRVNTSYLSDCLRPDDMNAFNRPRCLPGTRTKALAEVMETVLEAEQNTTWLHGVAGCGKSTVSTTIADYFRGVSRLGAFLFFERGKSEPSSVIRTMAFQLATFDSSISEKVAEAIEQYSGIASAAASRQFEKLLLGPLNAVANSMAGPVIVVLDSLDECGTAASRRDLMELLKEQLPRLPRNFRFVITSRREPDIDRILGSQARLAYAIELDFGSPVHEDVFRYIEYEMRGIMEKWSIGLPQNWESDMRFLAGAAEGLFIWASTAVKLVRDSDNPAQKLRKLISNSRALSGLDHLYDSILENSGISFDDERSKVRFSKVIGLILLSKVPLSDSTIDHLLGFPPEESSRLILSRLRCVLAYTPETSSPIRLFHTSFYDYLTSPERAGKPWYIDTSALKLELLPLLIRV